ncbi:EG45-like domain containing protein [Eucalyptus grandis]|uniref:EG45-like domain containing protein n=1 Tax=Eucalyptus grandis TaxID=71139 RepID=UPI00192ED0D7|nr:EG45-like domain containing protein [Eucalyptus grandis]
MGQIVMAIVFMSLMSKEIGLFVIGDVGTASSYDPPYTQWEILLYVIWCIVYKYTNPRHLSFQQSENNRADQFPPGNLFRAMSEGLWDNRAACGRRYRLRCPSGSNGPCKDGTVDVTVVDCCPKSPCPSTILLSTNRFSAISEYSSAKIKAEYIQ